ncbi:AAA family ATPase [Spiroplasma mirum]|nr:hypothetical protein [Spiroplasma mirum]
MANQTNDIVKNLFSNFDIYAYSHFNFDGLIFKLQVVHKLKYKNNENVEIKLNSDGYKALVWFLYKFNFLLNLSEKEPNKTFNLLADEIDKNVHPLLQMKIINYILKKCKK